MFYLQRTGKAQYQILEAIIDDGSPKIIVRDHFNDDRCMPCIKLIQDCNDNMGFSRRNDMIADCIPLIGNSF